VVLFLLELYSATGDATYLDEARTGADELLTKVPSEPKAGLYEASRARLHARRSVARDERREYHRAAVAAVRRSNRCAAPVGKGVQWNNTTDVISGSAGIALFSLYADERCTPRTRSRSRSARAIG
jgi:hypothetical protein